MAVWAVRKNGKILNELEYEDVFYDENCIKYVCLLIMKYTGKLFVHNDLVFILYPILKKILGHPKWIYS